MSRKQRSFLSCLIALLASASVSAQIFVPADQPTLQAAIDASPSGGTIIVTTTADQEPVTVDRAINIIGDPVCNIDTFCFGNTGITCVRLNGPGSGVVRLSNVRALVSVDCGFYEPLVSGGGFSALHLYDSLVLAPFGGMTGYGQSGPGISVTVPFLLLSSSTVRGGSDGVDICTTANFGPIPYLAYPAVIANEVLCIDSNVTGGRVLDLCCVQCPPCPPDLSVIGGVGAVGIQATSVWVSGGSVQGGRGASIIADTTLCGTAPNGLAVSAQALNLPTGFLAGSSEIPIGTVWDLHYLATGTAFLNFDLNVQPPLVDGNLGYSFMGSTFTILFALPPGVPGTFSLPVPNNVILAGFELVFQIFDTSAGWSRPVAGVVVP